MDMQKQREAFEAWLFDEFSGAVNFDIVFCEHEKKYNHVPTQARWEAWQAAQASAVPNGFILVPKNDVYDHYIANHLKGTTCSVDVSELTGNDGDRIYGKLCQYDCLGSDGNTLIYDLESSNFKLVKNTGNTGDYVLVPKEPTAKVNNAGLHEYRKIVGLGPDDIGHIYKAMIEAAQEQS